MIFFSIATKLPQDFFPVQHIFPFWFKYLYFILWSFGIFSVLSLLLVILIKVRTHRKSLLETEFSPSKEKALNKGDVLKELKRILKETNKTQNYRLALHQVSSLIRTFFELRFKVELEEMTSREIRENLKERMDIGNYFIKLTWTQYRKEAPTQKDFLEIYNLTVDLLKKV